MTTPTSDFVRDSPSEPAHFPLVFGLDTFGDVTHDSDDRPLSHAQAIRNLVEEGVFAEQVGVDCDRIGMHHPAADAPSAADVVLASFVARKDENHVRSAVNVIS